MSHLPHLPRLLTSPRGAFSDPATPLTHSAHGSHHCHPPAQLPLACHHLPPYLADSLPFSGCQGTLLPPVASLLLFLPGVPSKAPVLSNLSHNQVQERGWGNALSSSPRSLLCLPQDTLMLSSGDLAKEWSVLLNLHKVVSQYNAIFSVSKFFTHHL